MWNDVIELYFVVSYILATDAADLAITPDDLQHHVAWNRPANTPVFLGFSERFRR
jgi:hypothetical protein